MVQYMVRKDTRGDIWHALACSLAIGSRVVGVMLPLVTLIWLLLEQLLAWPDKKELIKNSIRYLIYLCFLSVFINYPLAGAVGRPCGQFPVLL